MRYALLGLIGLFSLALCTAGCNEEKKKETTITTEESKPADAAEPKNQELPPTDDGKGQ